jgi:phospholipid/cholesterol/gamma-HCH transport system permease protein
MASPTTATRRPAAAASRAVKRSRARERGIARKLAIRSDRGQPNAFVGTRFAPSGLDRPPLHDFDRTFLPALLTRINEAAKAKVLTLQEYFILAGKSLRFIFARPFYGQDVIQQMDEIGVKSLGIVLLTGLFTGMVLALQSSVQLKTFGATMYIGNLVSASMIRELGPVLAGLMVAGRVGSGIAAQLGSMRVTEQIDALNTLGTDPIKKLVTPRVLAALIMLPVLTVINDFVGIIGGNIIASFVVGLPTTQYWRTVWDQIASDGFVLRYIPNDFIQGLSKPLVFGAIISITACYFGLGTTGGTEGVGQSTTRTVVTSSILILIVDYFITQLLLSVLTYGR